MQKLSFQPATFFPPRMLLVNCSCWFLCEFIRCYLGSLGEEIKKCSQVSSLTKETVWSIYLFFYFCFFLTIFDIIAQKVIYSKDTYIAYKFEKRIFHLRKLLLHYFRMTRNIPLSWVLFQTNISSLDVLHFAV